MKQKDNEAYLVLMIMLVGISLCAESLILRWEFWVPPLIVPAVIALCVMRFLKKPDYEIRKVCYYIFGFFAIFYHGVHQTSFFDIALVCVFGMVAFSVMDSVLIQKIFLTEYFALMGLQIYLAAQNPSGDYDVLTVSRILLHLMVVLLVYWTCIKAVRQRIEMNEIGEKKDARIEAVDADMEDFLSNISHELRTPVNVVNGMSEMLIKKNVGEEAGSIKKAGIRLAYQIEDIQDYTECKRQKVILEEDDYMSTSLINDVVMGFRVLDNEHDLELIVDLDPLVPTRMRGDVKKIHKIFRHLLENAVKFTRKGGIYVKMYTENTDYGVNLCIEMTDTGIGMDRRSIASVTEGMYQVNKKRNRSSGGIGLGLFIVYGFAHRMGGFVKIESEKGSGTTVRVTLPQKVTDETPCISLSRSFSGDILFHVRADKYKVPRVREFYRAMAANLATGIRVPLYPTQTVKEIERLKEKLDIAVIFMGEEEYEQDPEYFDELSKKDVVVAVSAGADFKPSAGSGVVVMPKPLYAYPVIKILNEGRNAGDLLNASSGARPLFTGVKALVVDDEPMNLVVATGLFKEYEMEIDTADSGKNAIAMFREKDYDVIFMDHMMPEMDGVEAMKRLRAVAAEQNKRVLIIALTANAVSGAREMFMKEGFNGFIAKPINIADFERVMLRELPASAYRKGGQAS